ncbi:hypothetical protein FOXB_03729, partial [Fusarium oxysporum f. sp. conglutinans Fo5176]
LRLLKSYISLSNKTTKSI